MIVWGMNVDQGYNSFPDTALNLKAIAGPVILDDKSFINKFSSSFTGPNQQLEGYQKDSLTLSFTVSGFIMYCTFKDSSDNR